MRCTPSAAPAAPGGYDLVAPKQLREASDRFDVCYSQRLLEASWQDGGHTCVVRALENMFALGKFVQAMMIIGTPDGRGYGPSFCYRR